MLGNYLGALKNWVRLQDTHDCIYCIVNSHAITVPQDPKELRSRTLEAVAIYLASGIDPKKSLIFVQSQVPQHAELAWVLGCQTWMGELNRMTQFKDKSAKQKMIGAGLWYYPVLMAADILLYNTNLVPVGHDQKQHIELARDVAIRMNETFCEPVYADAKDHKTRTGWKNPLFVIPEPSIPPVGARVMSLQDPIAKMSKSDENLNATIFLSDTDDEIIKKLKKAVTDSGTVVEYSDEKPGVKNLIGIQSAITGKTPEAIVASYAGKMYGHLKLETADIIISEIKPLREKFQHLLTDEAELTKILKYSAEKAQDIASKTLKRTYEAIGFIS